MSKRSPRIFVAGHSGMVGSAILRNIELLDHGTTITRSHNELDLTNQSQVSRFFIEEEIDQVYLCAAKVGGIFANNAMPAEFIYQNLMIEANIIHQAWASGVKKLLFLGSSCIYPRLATQPMRENALLTGLLEPTNEPYAIAKIAGIKLCESYNRQFGESHGVDYRSVMPTNLYGPGDNYHPEESHVIPGLIQRFHKAKEVNSKSISIWGSGRPKREFLFVEDMALASIYVMNIDLKEYSKQTKSMNSHINIGSGEDCTIKELAYLIANVVGFNGDIEFDQTKPDGAPRKLMDSSLINGLGWSPKISLEEGLEMTYLDYLEGLKLD